LVRTLERRRRADEIIAAQRALTSSASASHGRARRPRPHSWLRRERPTTLASA
jgi:hypothetical protein